jgi:LysR family transcriptional activator of nhaA
MNFKHLYYFWKVAATGSVARAGEELHITPQTISEQIRLLEEDLGTALFARHRPGRRHLPEVVQVLEIHGPEILGETEVL